MSLEGVVRRGQPFAPWPDRFRRKKEIRNSLSHSDIETFTPAKPLAGLPICKSAVLPSLQDAAGCGCAIFPSAEFSKGVA